MKTPSLGELVAQITVGWVGPMAHNYVKTGVPFLRTLNVKPYTIDLTDIKHIPLDFHAKIRKSCLYPGNVVVARTGKPGTSAVIPKWLTESNCSDLVIIRTGDKVDPRFLVYYLNSEVGRHHVSARNVGSVQMHFNIKSAKNLPFPSIEIDEQRRIAGVLGALDDKIELNRKMNQTLEEMAQDIFKSWFIDFDGHDDLVESELGLIPRGWKCGTLADLIKIQNGYAFKSKFWRKEGIPVVKIGSVKPQIVDLRNVSHVDKNVAIPLERFRLEAGDILVGMTGYVGEVGRIPPTKTFPLLNQRVGRVIFRSEFPNTHYSFIYCALRNHSFKKHATRMGHGSAQSNISGKDILSYPMTIPHRDQLYTFSKAIDPLLARILLNAAESYSLAELRDTLLPKLISGEIRVPEAEEEVEGAL